MNTWTRNVVIGASLVFVAGGASAQTANPFFVPPVFPGSGASITADFNGDGKPDLVFADGTVLLGNGDGTFAIGTKLSVTGLSAATLIATADFNGDGKPDLVVNSATLNTFSVLLGNGDGTFQAAIVTSTATPITSLTTGDLNGDGKADVLATTGSPAALYSFIGQGNGQFAAGIVSGGVSAGQLADFNGDGKIDLLPSLGTGVQLGQGNGTFGALQSFPTGALVGSVIGDFNADGKLDVLALGGTAGSRQLQVLFGNGDGTFHASTAAPAPAGTLNGSFGPAVDLNGDGKSEVLVTDGAAAQVLTSNGDGTFTAGGLYNVGNQFSDASNFPLNLSVADFNKDGKLDVAVFNTMLLGNGDGTLKGSTAIANFGSGSLTADVNKDGHPDIVSLTFDVSSNSDNINVYLNDGHANLTLAHSYPMALGVFSGFALGGIADVNGDGNPDIVGNTFSTQTDNWSLVVMLGNGDGSFQSPTTYPGGPGGVIRGFSLTDLNHDGKPDVILVASQIGAGFGVLNVMLNGGDGTFGSPSTYFASSPAGTLAVADFNGDGQPDVLVGTDANGIASLVGKTDGTFQPATYITNTACGTNCAVGLITADVNGDGKADVVESSTNSFQVLLSNGDGTFSALKPNTTNLAPQQAADLNGDGKIDLIGDSDGAGALTLLLGNGDGTFGSPLALQPPGIPLIADFNGDGAPDLAVQYSGSGQLIQLVWLFDMSTPVAPGFSLTAQSGGTATVAAGMPATYTLSLNGTGGFSGTVALSCSGAPTGAMCSVVPATVMVSGTTAVPATVTVTTTARGEGSPLGFNISPTGLQGKPIMVMSSLLASIYLILTILRLSRVRRPRPFTFGALAAMAALLFVIGGCGGGTSPSGNPSGGSQTGTPAGSYTIVVTATAGSGSSAVSHTTKLTLVIQ